MKNNKELLSEIQHALANEASLTSCLSTIYVLVDDGSVILAGSVGTAPFKNLARKIVKAVPGVDLLMEDLRVESPHPHRMGVQFDWASGRMALNPVS